jgi:hypothetical protein
MSGDPIGDDVRGLRRQRRLGGGAACVICGETVPVVLLRARRSLLEQHHIGGDANDSGLTVVVCRNHHAVLTEAGRVSGIALDRRAERSSLERLEAVLRGLADFFELLARTLRYWAVELATTVRRLDARWPDWRRVGS